MRPKLAAALTNRTRFLKEARAAAALTSDHIVTVYQVGQDNDVPFLAMQLLQGEPLDARLARERRLPVIDAVIIATQTAAGLAAAHDKGLVHRDIKPGNIWLEADRPGGTFRRVRILDLGLVRGTGGGTQLTTDGVVVGTPHFMAPEQAGGQPVDGRADLFSLGCVIYMMLSGKLAFPGQSTMAVLMALANHTPSPLTAVNPEVPPELSALVARLMAKAPEDRPGSAVEVADHLEAALAELPQPAGGRPGLFRASGVVGLPPPRQPAGSAAGAASRIRCRRSAPPAPRPGSASGSSVPTVPSSAVEHPRALDTHPDAGLPTPAPPAVAPPAANTSEGAARRGRAMGTGVGLVVIATLVAIGAFVIGKRNNLTPLEAVALRSIRSWSGCCTPKVGQWPSARTRWWTRRSWPSKR